MATADDLSQMRSLLCKRITDALEKLPESNEKFELKLLWDEYKITTKKLSKEVADLWTK